MPRGKIAPTEFSPQLIGLSSNRPSPNDRDAFEGMIILRASDLLTMSRELKSVADGQEAAAAVPSLPWP